MLRDYARFDDLQACIYLVTIEDRLLAGSGPGGTYALDLGRLAPGILARVKEAER